MTYGFGFSYRVLFDRVSWQINAAPLAWDRGDNAVVSLGTAVVWYPWMAQGGRRLGVASDTALRVALAGSVFHFAETRTSAEGEPGLDANGLPRPTTSVTTRERTTWLNAGAGVGFEFGAVQRPGFSVALDLLWTVTFARTPSDGFRLRQLLPLPAGTLVYHW